MPNYCQISFKVTGNPLSIEMFKDFVKSEDKAFDFNRIVPMPKDLDVESSSTGDIGYEAFYGDWKKVLHFHYLSDFKGTTVEEFREFLNAKDPQFYELGTRYKNNLENYQHTTWYSWSPKNWGTKWNACDVDFSETDTCLQYSFQTAWNFPEPIFSKLAQACPYVTITGTMDEEGGHFYGEFTCEDGQLTVDTQEGYRPGGPYDYGDDYED